MPTDIILDDEGKERIVLAATSVKTTAADLIMDCPTRHTGHPAARRAMVHDQADGLTLNYNSDYPGGLTLNDARVRLQVHLHHGMQPELPGRGVLGELYLVNCIPIKVSVADQSSLVMEDRNRPASKAEALGRELSVRTIDRTTRELTREVQREGELSLWLCIGKSPIGIAQWQRIGLGDTISGTI